MDAGREPGCYAAALSSSQSYVKLVGSIVPTELIFIICADSW